MLYNHSLQRFAKELRFRWIVPLHSHGVCLADIFVTMGACETILRGSRWIP